MAEKNLRAACEALLFSVGNAVDADELATALEITKKELLPVLKELMEEYENDNRGIKLIEVAGKYQLCTKNDYFDELSRLVNIPKKHTMTDVLLETLSIIAYKQPVTRQDIEKIRGVSCSFAVNRLIEYNLVEEVGRLDAPGHPILFGTTDDFLRAFGLSSTDELPEISAAKIADFQRQAEEEAGIVTVET